MKPGVSVQVTAVLPILSLRAHVRSRVCVRCVGIGVIGVSVTWSNVFPIDTTTPHLKAYTRSRVSLDVLSVLTTSTSFMICTGLKKCSEQNLSGLSLTSAMSPI